MSPLAPGLSFGLGMISAQHDPRDGRSDTEIYAGHPKAHQAGGPPVWIGARSRAGLRRTARVADGLIAARVSPAEFARQIALLDAEASAAGRDPAALSVAVHCPVFAWPAAQDAWRLVEPHLHYSEWKYGDMTGAPYGTRATPAVQPLLTEAARAKIRAGALVGPPARVADGIAAYAAAAGDHPFHFIARLYWPGMDPGLMRAALTVHAEQVIPAVRDRVGRSGPRRAVAARRTRAVARPAAGGPHRPGKPPDTTER